jgi:hypothetical protein
VSVNITPPTAGKEDDPRQILWVSVDELVIDEDIQREVDEAKHKIFHNDWNWDLAEIPTVSARKGNLVVTEGQHRVLRRKELAPHSHLWVVKRPGASGTAAEAEAAQGIAKGRRGHSALAQWDLRLHAGDPYVTAGDRVLSELGLVMGAGSTAAGIMAAQAVYGILTGGKRTPQQGEELLRRTLTVLASAWPDDYAPGARWEGTLVRAVAHLLDVNAEIIDTKKLTARLSTTSSAEAWLKRTRERSVAAGTPRWHVLAGLLGHAYNNAMRRDDRRLAW